MPAPAKYDVDEHMLTHPFPVWVLNSFAADWRQGKGWTWTKTTGAMQRELLALVASEIVKWLQTLPLGVEITSTTLAHVIAPCPEELLDQEEKWVHVLCNRIGDMRFLKLLDGYWRDEPNKRRPTQPHKRYYNGIPA